MLSKFCSNVLVIYLFCTNIVFASPSRRSEYAVKERHHVPRQWSRISSAPSQHLIQLSIGLKQSRFSELERHLYEGKFSLVFLRIFSSKIILQTSRYSCPNNQAVSDPTHQRYGQHLSAAEVNELVTPSDEALSSVRSWLQLNNISSTELQYSPAKDWIKITLTVDSIEKLLDTNYSVYKHEDGSYIVRTPEWSLPQNLHEHVQTIQPTNSFFRPIAQRKTLKTVPFEDGIVIPTGAGNNKARLAAADVCNVNVSTANWE